MPFRPRHETSYQWPTPRCGWVSGAGAAFQCRETRGAQRCQSGWERLCGVWDEFVRFLQP